MSTGETYTIIKVCYCVNGEWEYQMQFYKGEIKVINLREDSRFKDIPGLRKDAYWYGIVDNLTFPVRYPIRTRNDDYLPLPPGEYEALMVVNKKPVKIAKPRDLPIKRSLFNSKLQLPVNKKIWPEFAGEKEYRKRGECCFYCKDYVRYENITRDHIKPRSKGNPLEGNMVFACWNCNGAKGSLSVSEFMYQCERLLKTITDKKKITRLNNIIQSCKQLNHGETIINPMD